MNTTDAHAAALAAALAELGALTIGQLVQSADCVWPQSPQSVGAELLASVRTDTAERFAYAAADITTDADAYGIETHNHSDTIAELADSAPSVYTYTVWQQFTDLGAYDELSDSDTAEWAASALAESESYRLPMIALCVIAERLARALWDMAAETYAATLAELAE